MKLDLSDVEGRVLHGLVEEASGDIVVRIDPDGFIIHASQNAAQLGHDLSAMLVMPHISDLAERGYDEALGAFVAKVFAGKPASGWCEFPLASRDDPDLDAPSPPPDAPRWFALSLRLIDNEDGSQDGERSSALGLIRSVQHRHTLEGELYNRALTDPLTGLANRHTLCANLRRQIAEGRGPVLAILAIDRMRALFMQYGQRTTDEIMWGFAKFLETMALPACEVAQLDNERFAVVLPEMDMKDARGWAEDVLKTFSSLALPSSSRAPKLSASAGLAPVESSVDWTLRQAELALVIARAGGGMRVSECAYKAVLGLPVPLLGNSTVGVAAAAR